jgi:hypothetical protein
MKVINTVTKRTMEAGPDGCITFRDQVVRHPAVRRPRLQISYSEPRARRTYIRTTRRKWKCKFGALCNAAEGLFKTSEMIL